MSDAEADDTPRDHLQDLADGCGCAELWEYLSERRDADGDGTDGEDAK